MFNYCWEDGANQKKIHWSAWWKCVFQRSKEVWVFVISIVVT
jgi:hypothetical protein